MKFGYFFITTEPGGVEIIITGRHLKNHFNQITTDYTDFISLISQILILKPCNLFAYSVNSVVRKYFQVACNNLTQRNYEGEMC